jgi:hypothetical protein
MFTRNVGLSWGTVTERPYGPETASGASEGKEDFRQSHCHDPGQRQDPKHALGLEPTPTTVIFLV